MRIAESIICIPDGHTRSPQVRYKYGVRDDLKHK